MFGLFISIIMAVYIPMNYYVGRHIWQSLRHFFPSARPAVFWVLFFVLASSFFLARTVGRSLPAVADRVLTIAGNYWLVAVFYLLFVLITFDIARGAGRLITGTPVFRNAAPYAGLAAVLLVAAVLAYGSWNARNPQVTKYDITINKNAGPLQELHVVMVSDLHLGELIDARRLEKIAEIINGLNPDLVVLPGDIVQEVELLQDSGIIEAFGLIKPELGMFASLGNHEYYGGLVSETVKSLEHAGIRVLRDDYVKVADSFYLVGREERSRGWSGGTERRNLGDVLTGVDKSLPVILLNHQPVDLDAAKDEGVDLQLSGHTHNGQVFPANLITSRVFQQDWGYLQLDTLQLIVSCGVGAWGPPLRIGSKAEIVDIHITFKK